MNNEEDILFQIDMQLYDEFNDTLATMNDHLGDIYTLRDVEEVEQAEKNKKIQLLTEAIKKQQKEIEDKKEKIYAIAKTNYTVGMLDERSQWYKKINEKIEILEKLQKEFPNNEEIRIKIIALKELIGKEE